MSRMLLLTAVVFFISKYLIRFFKSSLSHIPGPIFGRLSTLYRIWLLSDGQGPVNYAELHARYGPVVQTGPNHISVSDSSLIPTVYDLRNIYLKVPKWNISPISEIVLTLSFSKSKFYDVF